MLIRLVKLIHLGSTLNSNINDMKLKVIVSIICASVMLSCTDLDMAPVNIVNEEDLFANEAGILSYLSNMYANIPLEDFRYAYESAPPFNNSMTIYAQPSGRSGEALGRDAEGSGYEAVGYWNQAYSYIRDANLFLEVLPQHASSYTQEQVNCYLGEAYFIRAMVYFSLVKRYGGVPIVDKVIDYPSSVSMEDTKLPRASEEDTWNFIGADLDKAIELLPESNQKGRANKYAAAAIKSRAMLFAGSIAKYNTINFAPAGDVRVCGIPKEKAIDYFRAAYEASLIVDEGGYHLYMDKWTEKDRQAQIDNFTAIFLDDTYETIFGRYYSDPEFLHQFDNSAQPMQTSNGDNNSEVCPTLDFVEMFEFANKDANGKFESFDANGHYKLYASPLDAFANCEPRLAATVILPMSEFKGQTIEIRRGILTGKPVAGMGAILQESDNYASNYNAVADENTVKLVNTFAQNNDDTYLIQLKDGSKHWNDLATRYPDKKDLYTGKMRRSGESGPVSNWDYGNLSGFYLRKYMNPDPSALNGGNYSSQPWIEIRYAEVLLNRAEAAWELVSLGDSKDAKGKDYLSVATDEINSIRKRAGATELPATLTGDENSRDIIRAERRKELAFENKTYWDLRRWRIMDTEAEQKDRKYRILCPFFSVEDDAYLLDVKYTEPRSQNGVAMESYIYSFEPRQYYQKIDPDETTRNPNCKQNQGY